MNQADAAHFRDLLLRIRKDLYGQMEWIKHEESETSLREEDGDNSNIGMHLADQGTDCMAQTQNFMVVEYESRILYQVDQALRRIERDQYGICEFCGCNITNNRLEAIPYAALCLTCQEKEEGLYSDNYSEPAFDSHDDDPADYY